MGQGTTYWWTEDEHPRGRRDKDYPERQGLSRFKSLFSYFLFGHDNSALAHRRVFKLFSRPIIYDGTQNIKNCLIVELTLFILAESISRAFCWRGAF